jgi:caffeoyl-CoA O-methyltransferase
MDRSRRFQRAYFGPREPALDEVLRAALLGDGLRPMQMDDNAARVLALLVSLCEAKAALEIGTYFGWSAIHICRALGSEGTLVTLEVDHQYARLAQENLNKFDLTNGRVLTTDAVKFMRRAATLGESFDLIFIDGAKRQYPQYLELAYPLLRPCGLLVADDCFADGDYSSEHGGHEMAANAILRYVRAVAASPNLTSYLIPTEHGLLVSRKRGDRLEMRPLDQRLST